MSCSSCGRKTTKGVKFCSNCGSSLASTKATKQTGKKTKSSSARKKKSPQNSTFAYLGILLVALTAVALGASLSNTDLRPTSQGAEPDFENMTLRQLCTQYPLVAETLGRSCKNFQSYATPTPPENLADVSNRKDRSSESEAENKQPDGGVDYFRDIDDYNGDVIDDCIAYQTYFDGPSHYSGLIKNEGMKFRRYMTTTFQSPEFAKIYQQQSKAIYETQFVDWEQNLTQFAIVCYKEAGFALEGNN